MRTRKESMESKNCREPRLRLPGFEGEWVEKTLGESFDERSEKNRSDLPLLSLGENGLVYQSETARKDNSSADKSKYLRVAVGDIAYNTMRMWQGRCVHADIEGIVSPAYTVCKPREGVDSLFHYYLFRTQRMIQLFHQNSQGLVSDTLNLKYDSFSKIKYLIPPSLAEQEKIAHCLSEADNMITAQEHKVESLKAHKKGLIQQLFPQAGTTTPSLRFPGFIGEWQEKPFDSLCHTITPPLKLQSSQYLSSGKYPVIDQSQSLICGWTNDVNGLVNNIPSIIFGDHTCVLKFIDFPFVQGADGVKILSPIVGNDPRFVYQLLLSSPVKQDGYKRHFSDLKEKTFCLPPTHDEQNKLAECLFSLDQVISAEEKELEALKVHKKGLMQQLFPQFEK